MKRATRGIASLRPFIDKTVFLINDKSVPL